MRREDDRPPHHRGEDPPAGRAADYRRAEAVRTAKEILAHYAPFEAKHPIELGNAYWMGNAGYFRNHPDADAVAIARESLARHRETVATNGLSALRAAA